MKKTYFQDRIRIKQSHFMALFNPVNPLAIHETVQFFRIDPDHISDWNQSGTALSKMST
jgi:hypothetical protein